MGRRSLDRNGKVIRVIVRPPDALGARRAAVLVAEALGRTRWGREARRRTTRFADDAEGAAANDLLVEVAVRDAIGSPAYAKKAHDLVQRLYDTGEFVRVEADIPVPTFDPTTPGAPAEVGLASGGCSGVPAAAAHDWALRAMRVPQALALLPPPRADGRGIRIGHPDTGYSDHFALGLAKLDRNHDRDVISDDDEARDPLKPPKRSFFRPIPNPGHGTATASVIVGTGDGAGFQGIATAATVVPIRTIESVVQVFDSDVAKAVRWARTHGCLIVSMSLGGKGFFGLQDAIQEAVDAGMIVMAAAGNHVGFVTAPASYDNCIGVAASTATDGTWSGSSRGSAVDVSAPGACVWAALFDWDATPPPRIVGQSNGTSYAVAHLAGAATLWLARHGHDALVARYGRSHIQAAFLDVLRRPGVCRRPPGWDSSEFGAGIIDVEALVREALPAPFAVAGALALAAGSSDSTVDRLAAQTARSPEQVAAAIDAVFGPGSSTDEGFLRRFEGELVYLAMADDGFRALLATPGAAPGLAAAATTTPMAASPQLRARLG